MKNKEYVMAQLKEKTNLDDEKIILVNNILEDHNLIGHNNKEKMKADFMSQLSMSEEEANELYNTCMEVIVKGIFKK